MLKIIQLALQFLIVLIEWTLSHLRVLFLDLDAVKDTLVYSKSVQLDRCARARRTLNWHYFLPFLVTSYLIVDCAMMIGCSIWFDENKQISRLFTHLIFPRGYEFQANVIMGCGLSMAFCIYSCLLVDPMLPHKYEMYLSVNRTSEIKVKIVFNGKVLNHKQAMNIYSTRQKAKTAFRIMMFLLIWYFETFFMYQFFDKWSNSVRDCILMVVIPIYVIYGCVSNLFLIFHFILTVRYIRIKLKFVLNQLNSITHKVNQHSSPPASLWRQFQRINWKIVALFGEIGAHNRFWSKYLSIYFIGYIVEICFFVQAYFKSSQIDQLERLMFILFAINCLVVLMLFTAEGSLLVFNCACIHKAKSAFCFEFHNICPLKYFSKVILVYS